MTIILHTFIYTDAVDTPNPILLSNLKNQKCWGDCKPMPLLYNLELREVGGHGYEQGQDSFSAKQVTYGMKDY